MKLIIILVVVNYINARCTGGNDGGRPSGGYKKGAELNFCRDVNANVCGNVKFGPCGRPKSNIKADIKDRGQSSVKGNAFQMMETVGRMSEVLKLVGNRFKPQSNCPPRPPSNNDVSTESLTDAAIQSKARSPSYAVAKINTKKFKIKPTFETMDSDSSGSYGCGGGHGHGGGHSGGYGSGEYGGGHKKCSCNKGGSYGNYGNHGSYGNYGNYGNFGNFGSGGRYDDSSDSSGGGRYTGGGRGGRGRYDCDDNDNDNNVSDSDNDNISDNDSDDGVNDNDGDGGVDDSDSEQISEGYNDDDNNVSDSDNNDGVDSNDSGGNVDSSDNDDCGGYNNGGGGGGYSGGDSSGDSGDGDSDSGYDNDNSCSGGYGQSDEDEDNGDCGSSDDNDDHDGGSSDDESLGTNECACRQKGYQHGSDSDGGSVSKNNFCKVQCPPHPTKGMFPRPVSPKAKVSCNKSPTGLFNDYRHGYSTSNTLFVPKPFCPHHKPLRQIKTCKCHKQIVQGRRNKKHGKHHGHKKCPVTKREKYSTKPCGCF